MAEAAAAPAAEAVPAPRKKTGLLVGLTLGGAVLGGLLAAFVVAPRIIARQAPAVADSTAAKPEHGKGEGESEPAKMVELENIIVNPAGSQGNRFLMTTVALAVAGEKDAKLLDDRKVELRDKVTTILESMTMPQLTSPGARDSLKARIATMTGEMLGGKASVKVFLPQFVIQ
jgi:flagellar basal body-associated protein FliL